MSTVIEKVQCPECLDSGRDNLVRYEGDSAYCFACGYTEQGDEGYEAKEKVPSGLLQGQYKDIPTRGLSKRTCTHFGYTVGEGCHIATYCDDKGNPVAQKVRRKGKKFSIMGDSSKMKLFGQHLYEPSEKVFVTVTEGEIDALSVAEVQGTNYPVVSIPKGANNAAAALKGSLEWLSGFKHIVLCLDNDEAGRAAIDDCVELFEPGKVKIAKLPLKDANEMLLAGKGSALKSALFNAASVRLDCVVSVDDIIAQGIEKPEAGLRWPWDKLTDATYGIRDKQIYTIGAGSGIGKTEFIKDIIASLCFGHDAKVGMLSFEQSPKESMLRFAGSMLGKRIHIPGVAWDQEEVEEAMGKFRDKLYFYDHKGVSGIDSIIPKIRYMVSALGCKYIVLDNLTAVSTEEHDERKGIDKIMATMANLTQEIGFTLFLICHLAKPTDGGKSYEQGRMVTPAAFRGSQSIQFASTFMMGLERDKFSEDESMRNVLTVRILKDRYTGESDGMTMDLKYDRLHGKLVEYERTFNQEGEVI
jgi:twinkle protein